ncbi:hypothetical protein [Streptomyces profundus]|uniref:hypothetical protein n=1 Tax=Streptomyces profundus TaxID=2867410 RepID=UPI001D15F71B|nr:hypothetical protein [Streptomyces sp. MA3_2.13]UED83447.1 hypothetical protein K4G22_03870 [Streptomyces sp. MA3_2.13]
MHPAQPAESAEHEPVEPAPATDAAVPAARPAPPREAEPADAAAEEGPAPLGVPVRATGHGPVDAVLARLADVDRLGVGGHPEVYEDVHEGLRQTLAALDQPTGPPVPRAPHPSRS